MKTIYKLSITLLLLVVVACETDDVEDTITEDLGCNQQVIDDFVSSKDDYTFQLNIISNNNEEYLLRYKFANAVCVVNDSNEESIDPNGSDYEGGNVSGNIEFLEVIKGYGYNGINISTQNSVLELDFKITKVGESNPVYEYVEVLNPPFSTFVGYDFEE